MRAGIGQNLWRQRVQNRKLGGWLPGAIPMYVNVKKEWVSAWTGGWTSFQRLKQGCALPAEANSEVSVRRSVHACALLVSSILHAIINPTRPPPYPAPMQLQMATKLMQMWVHAGMGNNDACASLSCPAVHILTPLPAQGHLLQTCVLDAHTWAMLSQGA